MAGLRPILHVASDGTGAHAFHAGRDHHVLCPAHHRLGGKVQRLLRRAALAVHRGGRHALRYPARRQHHVAADVARLGPRLAHAADDDVVNAPRVDAGALHQGIQDRGPQVDGVPLGEAPASAAARRANGLHNVGVGHRGVGMMRTALCWGWLEGRNTPRIRTAGA